MELPLSSRETAALARRPYTVPLRLLMLGVFATLAVLMIQQHRLLPSYFVPPSAPLALRPILAPRPVISPVLQAELAMSPQQLLDRWESPGAGSREKNFTFLPPGCAP